MHADIILRLEGLTGPDREVDVAIMAALLPKHRAIEALGFESLISVAQRWGDRGWEDAERIPYTSSLDAAVALVERVLPGADIGLSDTHPDFLGPGEARHLAEVMHDLTWVTYDGFPEPNYQTTGSGKANSRAIALLIALFRALDARARQESER